MLGNDELRAWYGPEHVALAADRGAVGTLLISDGLFRCCILTRTAKFIAYIRLLSYLRASDPKERNRYVAMVEAVREKGGEVCIFSSMHESGERRRIIAMSC
jgi:protein pelota